MHDVTHLPRPFSDPLLTAEGKVRASLPMTRLKTLWVNTGTQCNIECVNCYIESSPTNDRLVYFSLSDLRSVIYQYDSSGRGVGSRFTATAFGDLDCDGTYSTFCRFGVVEEDGVRGSAGIYIANELE